MIKTSPVSPIKYFALTFLLSWLVWIPLDLAHFGIAFHIPESASAIIRLLGVLMPAVSATILTFASGEKGALRQLLSRLTSWRVGWTWWIAAAMVFPVLLIASALISNWTSPSSVTLISQNIASLLVSSIFLLVAVLGEEIGWHGVALPALQQNQSALVSSLLLGVCMGFWHLPFWLLLDTFDQFGIIYLILNFLFVLPVTIYVTWFFNHSRSSLLLPVVFHLIFNIVNTALLPVTLNLGAFGILIACSWLLAIATSRHLEPPGTMEKP